jgi:hypothetical protein
LRQGLNKWSGLNAISDFAKKTQADQVDDVDDQHIRFTIGGAAGRRLTKEDFLNEIRSLDPKARAAMIEKSDAPAAMKDLARKDADPNIPGSNRVLGTRTGGTKTAGAVTATAKAATPEDASEASSSTTTTRTSGDSEDRAARHRRARALGALARDDERPVSPGTRVETAMERGRRDYVVRGGEDAEDAEGTPAERRRRRAAAAAAIGAAPAQRGGAAQAKDNDGETPAERRRRIAALGHSVEQDDEEGGGGSMTAAAVPTLQNEGSTASGRSRGIRFAEEPIRK